jgi:hypothetical protein
MHGFRGMQEEKQTHQPMQCLPNAAYLLMHGFRGMQEEKQTHQPMQCLPNAA